MIAIRTDANEKIAMGHLARCLTIAEELKKKEEVVFILSEDYARDYIEGKGFSCICLGNRHDEKNEELEKVKKIVRAMRIRVVLIDSYEVTSDYLGALREFSKIAYIDDLKKNPVNADMIINYAIDATDGFYPYVVGVKHLLGARYAPIRACFRNGREIGAEIKEVLITTGGTDPYDMLLEVVQAFLREDSFRAVKFHVVAGKFYQNPDKLTEMSDRYENIQIYHDITNMDEVMRKCDLAVSAGGTTLVELATMGVPTIAYSIADNQSSGVRAMEDKQLLLYAGDVRCSREDVIRKILFYATQLANDREWRKRLSSDAKKIYDGKGAYRIAESVSLMGVSG